MAEYIRKEDAITAILSVPDGNWKSTRYASEVEKLPAVDVYHAARGEWEKPKGSAPRSWIFVCSKCRERAYFPVPKYFAKRCKYKFCPNCGADMRGKEDGCSD